MKFIDPNYLCDNSMKNLWFDWLIYHSLWFPMNFVLFQWNQIKSSWICFSCPTLFIHWSFHFLWVVEWNHMTFSWFHWKESKMMIISFWSNSLHFQSICIFHHFVNFLNFIIDHSFLMKIPIFKWTLIQFFSQWQSISSFLQLSSFGDIIKLFSLSFVHHFFFKLFKWRWCCLCCFFSSFSSFFFSFHPFSVFPLFHFCLFSLSHFHFFSFWPYLQFFFFCKNSFHFPLISSIVYHLSLIKFWWR